MTESQMPLANSMSVVTSLFEVFRHDLDICSEAAGHQRLDVHVLPPHPVLDTTQIVSGHDQLQHGHLYGYCPVMKATLEGEQVGWT